MLVVLFFKLGLALLPQGSHAVESLDFNVILVFKRLFSFLVLFGLLLGTAVGYFHLDRETDIVGVLLDKSLDAVLVKEFAVFLIVGIIKEFEDYYCSDCVLVVLGDSVAVYTLALPAECLVTAVCLRDYGHLLSYHEC